MSYSHKPGSLKQQNKRHKSEKKRGTSNSNVKSRNSSKILNKQQRLSSLKQRRTLRTSMLKQAMLLRGVPENPIWCVFVPLTRTVPVHLANLLFQKCDPEALVDGPNGLQQVVQIYSRMFDKHFCLVSAKFGDLFGCIDLIQTADHVILVVPSDLTELDWSTESFLTALSAQGLPDATFAVMSSGANLKMIRNILQSRFPVPDDAVCQLNTTAHGISLMRRVCSALRGDSFKYKSPSESSHSAARFRSKLLANSISLTSANAENPDLVEESPSSETYLYIQGHLRGSPLFFRDPLEQLTAGAKGPFVHLAGWGDFPLAGAQWKDKRSGAQRWSVTDFVPQSDEGASALLRTSTISDASPCDSESRRFQFDGFYSNEHR
ncbi:unnamed protein product [Dicrocoelium dendriticum]|nr:unnamed protein product [Dicrocoelium dendriticum]